MEFELLKKSHVKRNIIIGILVVGIISAVILNFSKAKYRTTQRVPLVNGIINYTPYDFKMVAMYQMSDAGEYVSIDQIPTSGYTLNITESYCEIDGEKDGSIPMTYENGRVYIGVNTKGTKCYLYFDEVVGVSDTLLANYPTKLTRSSFTSTVTNTTTGTIYYADTSKGRTYYFAGNPTDNWVKFGGFYWRIIRINEDGTIRLIYQGTSANITGEGTQLANTSAFNSTNNNNMYVGYMYQSNQVHGLTSNSSIKGILDNWYRDNLATNYGDKIDGTAGFCGDRQPSTSSSSSNGQGGTGSTITYYGAYIRLVNSSKQPTFECASDSDLYTTEGSSQGNGVLAYPIGLISADEVAYAGGVIENNNNSYYLYTNQNYWTMSPYSFIATSSRAGVFIVYFIGGSLFGSWVTNSNGVRPVINLKANVTISGGNGSSSNPYIIS